TSPDSSTATLICLHRQAIISLGTTNLSRLWQWAGSSARRHIYRQHYALLYQPDYQPMGAIIGLIGCQGRIGLARLGYHIIPKSSLTGGQVRAVNSIPCR